jgi:quaternary ammonium compound-resistance protein SugE
MAWIYILLAAACEMVWPIGFKYSGGFKTHSWVIVATLGIMLLSFWLMSKAIAGGMHVGTAYAVWTGIGACGTAILGMVFYNEPHDLLRIACLMLIVAGAFGLKYTSPPDPSPSQEGTVSAASRGGK